ncbi:MAG: hypothetical protein ACW99F_20310 [Candidatus Hodarchaeales archaeon]|jgi:hypothetical protein
MKQQIFITRILLVLTALMILLLPAQTNANDTSLQYNLNVKYSGISPKNSAPWLTAVFDDNNVNDKDPNKVLLTMSVSNLALNEGVKIWGFNFAPKKFMTNELTFSHVSGPKAVEIDRTRKGGGWYFDIRFKFSKDEFKAGSTSVYEISNTSEIESINFSKLSTGGGVRGSYGSGALVYIVNGKNVVYGWVGDSGKGK